VSKENKKTINSMGNGINAMKLFNFANSKSQTPNDIRGKNFFVNKVYNSKGHLTNPTV
jgi:hypothetical protein